ncbi:carbohydrate ABC transporter permease [Cohnella sp. 56]|uniref:carbohydrate ABC transporter permease n=1 Tax=Cohnella sp. 56 TaxID=3113722 RepID=UPI0030E8C8EE
MNKALQLKKRGSMKRENTERVVLGTLFLFVPLAFLIVFSYYPAVRLFQLSFSDWDGLSNNFHYVGFDNYKSVARDETVMHAFRNTLAYVAMMFVQLAIALYVAVVLDSKIRAKNFFRSVIALPFILNGAAVVYLFTLLYDYQASPINFLLQKIGLDPIHFLPNSYALNLSLAFMGLWKGLGLGVIIFLGSLQSIPRDLYEAAEIDGASYFQAIRYISIPNITRIIELQLFLGITGSLQAYGESLITFPTGGPGGIADTLMTRTLSIAFKYSQFGRAAAMGVMLMILILLVVGVQRMLLRRNEASE